MAELTNVINRYQGAGTGNSGYHGSGLPSQTVTVDEKEKPEWQKGCMYYFAEESRRQSREKQADVKKYKLLSPDFQYPKNSWVFDPLFLGDKKEEQYGATDPIQHYPIMNQPLNTIWGERINRTFRFYCLSNSPDSINAYNRNKTELLFESASQSIQQAAMQKAMRRVQAQGVEIDEQILQQIQEEAQQMSAPAIQRYMDKDYVDTIEQSSNRMMKNIWATNNLDDEFIEGFKHMTICGKEAYSTDVFNQRLKISNINPFALFYHKSDSVRWISEGQYAGYRRFLTPSSVIDMHRDKLTVDDIRHIEEKMYPNTKSGGMNSLSGIKSINYDVNTYANQYGLTYRDLNADLMDDMLNEYMTTGVSSPRMSSQGLIEVVQAYWKSYRKAGVLHWYDEADDEQKMWVDENYVPDENNGEYVKWFFLNQVYQGSLIDDDIVLDVCPYPYQIFDSEDPDFCVLPIEGYAVNDFNGRAITITDLMMPWQEMYDIVAYELRRDMKKAIGKVMFMSIDHIPNIPGFDMNKWMYWCREFGIAWVGEGKKRSQFSHYSAQDMSFAEQLVAKMNMLERIKYNCDSFAGFSQPRMANTSKEATAQQSELSQANSVNQTEYYFWKHSQCIQRVLTNALNISKKLLKSGTNIYLRNMYDDVEQKYLELDAARVRNANLNLFVVHGSQAIMRTESVRQMAMAAAGKTGESTDMADLILATTENEIKQNLREIRRATEQRRQQEMEHEQAIGKMEQETAVKKMDWEKEKHYSKLESDERREYMRTFINQDDNMKDADNNGMEDIFEGQKIIEQQSENLRKHQRELRKQDQDANIKNRELSILDKKLGIERDKNKVARENMVNDEKIARLNLRGRSKKST